MGSSQRPPVTLPQEPPGSEESWADDEQPTLAKESRTPTRPASARDAVHPDRAASAVPSAPAAISVPQHGEVQIELAELDDDIQKRVTTRVPEQPLDDYARRMMSAEAQQAVTEAPPPFSEGSQDGLEADISNQFELDNFENGRPSELPTAPPPDDFERERARTYPKQKAMSGEAPPWSGDPSQMPTDSPPAVTRPPAGSQMPFLSTPHGPPEDLEFSLAPSTGSVGQPGSSSQAMKDKFAMGDFSGALQAAHDILSTYPEDPEATSVANKCEEVLHDMYASRIAGLSRVPQITMGPDQIRWLSLDHRAGFMLSMIDNTSSVEDLLDVCGMAKLDALRILCALLDQKVISLRAPR